MDLPARATILFAAFDGWDMPPYQRRDDVSWIHGGVRSMIELAAGLAAIGLDVELRGGFAEHEVAAIEDAAGVRLGRPEGRRRPESGELVIVPEAHDDPLTFARVALSGARAVLWLLAPLGLFGWAFDETTIPQPEELLTLDPDTVGRSESLQAARSLGFELWTNARPIAERAASAGIRVSHVGTGRPTPYPEPGEKSVDVLALAENRWGALAAEALGALPGRFSTRIQERGTHTQVLAALSAARVFVHPARIEGRSRLCEEARAMRAIPVLLASNRYGEGYGPEYGSLIVDSVGDMPAAVAALLDDPERLAALAGNGYRTAREACDWNAYKERLREVVAMPDAAVSVGRSMRSAVGRRFEDEHAELLHALAESEQERDHLSAEVTALRERMALIWVRLDEAVDQARELNEGLLGLLSSSSWQVTRPLRATMTVLRGALRMLRGRAARYLGGRGSASGHRHQ